MPFGGASPLPHYPESHENPPGLQALIDDGVIDEVLRPLKSGKEASVYVVRCGDECAAPRSTRTWPAQLPGARAVPGRPQGARQPRGARDRQGQQLRPQASRKPPGRTPRSTRFTSCADAGVRVPKPHGYFHGVLVMELVTDADGHSAPRLGEVELTPERRASTTRFLIRQVVRMLCCGLIHGDLSEYNVLVAPDGPVIIDLPQVVERRRQQRRARDAAARRQQPQRQPRPLRAGTARRPTTARRCGRCSRPASCSRTANSPAVRARRDDGRRRRVRCRSRTRARKR